jgi:curved DNA-binding protein CbpA
VNNRQCRKILFLPTDFTINELKQHYKRLVKTWHPDRYGNDHRMKNRAERKIREINLAYDQLKDYAAASKKHNPGNIQSRSAASTSVLKSRPFLENFGILVLSLRRSLFQLFFGNPRTKNHGTARPVSVKPAYAHDKTRFQKQDRRVPVEFKLILRNAEKIRTARQNTAAKTGQKEPAFEDRNEKPALKRKAVTRKVTRTTNRRRSTKVGRIRPVRGVGRVGKV